MDNQRTRILFLCTGNSARSIMAEAIANEMFGEKLSASSAGSRPKGQPHTLALATLKRHRLPAEKWRSKSWDELRDQPFDLVVTLCDSAAKEACPVFPGAPVQAHWGFPDPPAASASGGDPEAAFEAVFQGLVEAIRAFAEGDESPIDVKAAKVAGMVKQISPT